MERSSSPPLILERPLSVESDNIMKNIITVSDDGVGMDEDKAVFLGEVRQRSEGTGIALKNVNGRLKGYFGEDSTLLVESTPDVGTTVTMTLSGAQRMEEDEDE